MTGQGSPGSEKLQGREFQSQLNSWVDVTEGGLGSASSFLTVNLEWQHTRLHKGARTWNEQSDSSIFPIQDGKA